MPRNPDIPRADYQYLRHQDEHGADDELIRVGSQRWFEWLNLEDTRSFAFESYQGYFTARKENKQRGNEYWYAYRWLNGKTTKAYLGTSNKLTRDKLNEVAIRLSRQQLTLPLIEGG